MSLTPAQKQAIAARGNVLVIAGAGTGKTRTLVERCLSCLLEESPPASLDEILMVTFTEAAAAEMRQRIRARLEEQLKQHPEELRWHEQLALFESAHIGTLHGFCLQLVRSHFYELELDPQMSVLAEEEARLLAEETLTSVLEGHYAGRTPEAEAVQQLIQVHGSGSDQPVRALVLRLHHYTQTLPDPAGWFQDQIAKFAAPEPVVWEHWLLRAFAEWRAHWLPRLEANDHGEIVAQCAAALRAVPAPPTRLAMAAALEQAAAATRDFACGSKTGWLKSFREFETEIQFLLSLAAAKGKTDPLAEDWNWVRGQMATLLQLAREFDAAFSQNKRELGMSDFHDLEQHSLRLLWDPQSRQPTRIAWQWRQRLRWVFVDEYQDINAAQDKIIEALSGEGPRANRFLVGDVKQSIYRFRLANPYIFQHYATTWREGLGQAIPLVDNFRSREGLLNFVNSFFARVMRPELGGMPYDETAQLKFGARAERHVLSAAACPEPCVELHLRLKKAAVDPGAETVEELAEVLELEETDKEARLVALRLRELKAQQHPVWDETTERFRPVEWSDMALLLRSPANKAERYAKEFSRLNIPLLVQRTGFYESVEISDLISLLQVLDNPLQDLPVLAVLHSPLAGLTVNELATIRLVAKGPFWTALVLWADRGRGQSSEVRSQEPEGWLQPSGGSTTDHPSSVVSLLALDPGPSTLVRKVTTFLDRFARWRRLARQESLSRCLEAVLGETHYADWLLTQPRGDQRHANVQRLLGLAQQFDKFQRQGLFRFLCLIEAQQRADTEPEVQAVSAENSVRLMSIHQSKGLEFPVVVVADLGKRFNLADLRAEIILDEEYGLCPQIKPPHTGKRYPSLPYWLARRRQQRELLGEELRLLYVAMTRARDTLLLSASLSATKFEKLWQGKGGDGSHVLTSPSSYSDWLGLWFSERCLEAQPAMSSSPAGPLPRASPIDDRLIDDEAEVEKKPATAPIPMSGANRLLRWTIHDERKLIEPAVEAGDSSADASFSASPELWQRLRQRFSWEYPFLGATRTPAKASVTALRRRAALQLNEDAVAMFHRPPNDAHLESVWGGPARSDHAISPRRTRALHAAADIGSVHHAFQQLVSLERTGSVEELKEEVKRLEKEQALTAEEIVLLDLDALAGFWSSDLGQNIRAKASYVQRELPFTARFSPQALAEVTREPLEYRLQDEFVIVQGVADLVVLLPQEIWLLDFKTDALNSDEVAAKAKLYRPQMKLYARALAQIFARPVTQCWLYFLRQRMAIPVRDP